MVYLVYRICPNQKCSQFNIPSSELKYCRYGKPGMCRSFCSGNHCFSVGFSWLSCVYRSSMFSSVPMLKLKSVVSTHSKYPTKIFHVPFILLIHLPSFASIFHDVPRHLEIPQSRTSGLLENVSLIHDHPFDFGMLAGFSRKITMDKNHD